MAQRVANTTIDYFDMWRLIVNPQKTQIAIMNSSGRLPPPNLPPIEIKGVQVPYGKFLMTSAFPFTFGVYLLNVQRLLYSLA